MGNQELEKIFETLILDRGISEIFHQQDFFIDLIKENVNANFPPNIRIQLYSDWRLNDKMWWDELVINSPLNTKDLSMPLEPIRGYSLLYLKDCLVSSVKILDHSDLVIYFSKNNFLFIPGTNETNEFSWIIDASNDPKYPDFRISCDEFGRINISSNVLKLLN